MPKSDEASGGCKRFSIGKQQGGYEKESGDAYFVR